MLPLIALLFLQPSAFALQSGDYTYSVSGSDTITITGYTGSGGAVEIPNTIDSKPVISIGSYAFYQCTSLTSISIGSGVTSIETYAFSGCTGLTSVILPDSVTSIGYSAFWNCTGLTSIGIGSGVTSIGAYAFERCTGLTSVTIPASVTGIGEYGFYNCTGLTRAYFLGNAPEMGDGVFDNCARGFKVQYTAGSTGFTILWWHGYPATPFNKCPAQKALGNDCRNLEKLRFFRDSTLARSTIGRRAIQIYYNNADSINAALDRSPALMEAARRVLEALAPMVGR
jgi:hypothetical protein